jgi:hypothetical protein
LKDSLLYPILYVLEELVNIFSALNWGSVKKKTEKLIESGLESRVDDVGEDEDCITKFFIMMSGKKFHIFSFVITISNLLFIILVFGLNFIAWINNDVVFGLWILDFFIMIYFSIGALSVFCKKKKDENNENKKEPCNFWTCCYYNSPCCTKISKCIILFFLTALFCLNILLFYAIFFSHQGNIYISLRCNGTFDDCNKLIRTKYTEYKYNFTSSSSFEFEQKSDYYDQIYLKKGSKGTLALALLMRSLIFIRLFLAIAKLFFFANLAGPLKKVVYFIKNSDGTITDLKDINIVEEIQEKFKGNKKENFDGNNKNENNKKSKYILLKQVILNKKIDPSLNRNLNYPINQNILANGQQTQVVYIDNNNLNNLYSNRPSGYYSNNFQNNFIGNINQANFINNNNIRNEMLYLNFGNNNNQYNY